MNILIFSVSIGNGHDQVAHTIRNEFLSADPENNVRIINTISLISPLLDKVILDSYLNIIKFYPKAWGKIYEKTNKLDPIIDINEITNKLLSTVWLRKPKVSFEPDIVFCTHSFPSSIVSNLKEKGKIKCPLVTIVTDFNIHSSYINDNTDYYVIPHEDLIYVMENFGVSSDKVLPFGIPIRREFSLTLDRTDILQKLKLQDKRTILVMGGGLGLGSINRIVKELDRKLKNIQIIAIAGHNEKLENKLKSLDTKNDLVVYGFINNIHELIEVSDIIITKPGGVTVAEVLSREKPLIIFSPIPGQESDNAEFLLNNGVAATTSDIEKIPLLINQILNNEIRIDSMKKLSAYLKKPYSAKNIIDFVIKTYG
ncbi:MGDG synthase family glycosyltransferase [Lutispora thermophila]|uniref:Processive 1,2-diacylglycerol beta-glucosyltransferase n=1 Tax=Lutispora thermophila DSM 19022 TaxID=1122184 RepID=A0A1M6GQK3_9FIRM|nr:glycosyltransferase [Lutispora thermophila]SHJ12251.1 processive 1,2-diacylglycerol beta-glucosyltransferase [Lutispora thermophila DSM 19022]